jgi:hypothetical protein
MPSSLRIYKKRLLMQIFRPRRIQYTHPPNPLIIHFNIVLRSTLMPFKEVFRLKFCTRFSYSKYSQPMFFPLVHDGNTGAKITLSAQLAMEASTWHTKLHRIMLCDLGGTYLSSSPLTLCKDAQNTCPLQTSTVTNSFNTISKLAVVT